MRKDSIIKKICSMHQLGSIISYEKENSSQNDENNQDNIQNIESDLENAGNVYVGTLSTEEFCHLMEKMFNFKEELTGPEYAQRFINH